MCTIKSQAVHGTYLLLPATSKIVMKQIQAFKKEINSEYCAKAFRHVQKIEEKYWEAEFGNRI